MNKCGRKQGAGGSHSWLWMSCAGDVSWSLTHGTSTTRTRFHWYQTASYSQKNHGKQMPPNVQVWVVEPWESLSSSFPFCVFLRRCVLPSSQKRNSFKTKICITVPGKLRLQNKPKSLRRGGLEVRTRHQVRGVGRRSPPRRGLHPWFQVCGERQQCFLVLCRH